MKKWQRETTPSFKPVREFAPKLKNSHAIVAALLLAQKNEPFFSSSSSKPNKVLTIFNADSFREKNVTNSKLVEIIFSI